MAIASSTGRPFYSAFYYKGWLNLSGRFWIILLDRGHWGILLSVIMFKSSDYGKFTSIIGIIGFALEQDPPKGLYPKIWGQIDPFLIGIGGVFIMVWYFLVYIKILTLSRKSNNSL